MVEGFLESEMTELSHKVIAELYHFCGCDGAEGQKVKYVFFSNYWGLEGQHVKQMHHHLVIRIGWEHFGL